MDLAERTAEVRRTSVGWMIQRLARRLDDEMSRRLSAHGLSIQSFAVLMTVLERGPLTQTEIGQHFGMPAYAISRALDALSEAGVVKRQPHPTSRRAHSVEATARAEALAPILHGIVAEVNAALMAGLPPEDRAALCRILSGLVGDLGPCGHGQREPGSRE
ncbi:MAG: MarR family winged helix-turn-helix transcriptional regulator [Pseudomonadota bacterium]